MATNALFITIILGALLGCVVSATIYALAGDNVTLPCNESDVLYPAWRGPIVTNTDVLYTYPNESRFRTGLVEEKGGRLKWDNDDNRSLVLENVSRSDEGTYTCTIRPNVENRIELSLLVLPKPVISGKTYIDVEGRTIMHVTEGEDSLIVCRVPNGNPRPSLTWNLYPTEFPNPFKVRDGEGVVALLPLSPSRSDHRKRYTCQSSFGDLNPANKSTIMELYVNLKPSIPIVTSYIAVEGEPNNATHCVTTGFRPRDIEVEWRLRGVNLTDDGITTIENPDAPETFNVTSVYSWTPDRADNGLILECIVYHKSLLSPITGSATLIVKYKAKVTNFTNFDTAGKQTLHCTAEGDPPPTGMAIYRQGQSRAYKQGHVLINATNVNELQYTMQPSDCLMSDPYSCTTFNEYNMLDPDVEYLNISTNCPPKRIEKIVVKSNKEDPITLNITIMAFPIPETNEVTWYRHERGTWVRQDGGFVEYLAENEFICGLNLLMNDSGSGYYQVVVGNGMASTYTQIFNVEFTEDEAQGNEEGETTSPLVRILNTTPLMAYIILPTSGCVIGIIVTLLGVRLRNKYSAARLGDGGRTENIYCRTQEHASTQTFTDLRDTSARETHSPSNHTYTVFLSASMLLIWLREIGITKCRNIQESSFRKIREAGDRNLEKRDKNPYMDMALGPRFCHEVTGKYQNVPMETRKDAADEHVYGMIA